MTLYAKPGASFLAPLEDAPVGLVPATLECGIFLRPAGTVVSAYSKLGITEEHEAGGATSDYEAVRVAPAALPAAGSEYFIQWRNGTEVVREMLVLTETGTVAVLPSALLDRVKARVESDLSDAELQALITEAQDAIADRYGPAAGAGAITVTIDGGTRTLDLVRPAAAITSVTEHLGSVADAALDDWAGEIYEDTQTVLAAGDYRIRNGGRTLERIFTGPNARARWGTRIDIVYTPVSDQTRRDEVTIKLVALAVEYEGVVDRRVGDTMTTHAVRGGGGGTIYQDEREQLLGSLAPRGGLFFR